MSVVVSTCDQINRDPNNNSQSKQLWSFPKANRFIREKKESDSTTFFYDIKESKNKLKGAFIGYGNKSDFTLKNARDKCPNFYDIKGGFGEGLGNRYRGKSSKNPAYSFGIGWDAYSKLYDENIKFNYNPNMPGPGTYTIKLKPDTSSYSFKGRNFYKQPKTMIPGPGNYRAYSMNPTGYYTLSNKRSTPGTCFGKFTENRFADVVKSNVLI